MENNEKEILYNGIRLPEEWPPRNLCDTTLSPISVPYLENPPTVIYMRVFHKSLIFIEKRF